MKPIAKMILGGAITVVLIATVLGLSFIYLPEGYFVAVLIAVAIFAWILEHFITKYYGEKDVN